MSVLIKGMETQKNCGWCPLRGSCVHRIYMECRPEDCPLIEVPEPHGRLIDADALCASHKEVCSRSMKFNLDLAQTVIQASTEGS